MKKIAISLLLLLSFGCSRKPAAPVGEGGDALFVPLKPSLTKLANGMEVMVLEDHEFPTLQMQVYVKGGALYDPPGKEDWPRWPCRPSAWAGPKGATL
jgi:hypothetical protein